MKVQSLMEVVKDLNRAMLDKKVRKLDIKITTPVKLIEPTELPKTKVLDPRESDEEEVKEPIQAQQLLKRNEEKSIEETTQIMSQISQIMSAFSTKIVE